MHSRLLDHTHAVDELAHATGATVWYSRPVQVRRGRQSRSDVSVGCALSNSLSVQDEMDEHWRFDVVVAALEMYWSSVHTVWVSHTRSEFQAGAFDSNSVVSSHVV